MKKLVRLALTLALFSNFAAAETITKSMSFEQCLKVIRGTAGDIDLAPTNVVETDVLRVVKWFLSDGEILLACSKPDRKMLLVHTPK